MEIRFSLIVISFFFYSSVPFTLSFCSSLSELYLDHNLLDALPGFLLRMPRLSVVHRHGNHNYFKATFMWYHTDVNNRILEDPGQQQQQYLGTCGGPEKDPFLENSLQESAALAILAARIDFYQVFKKMVFFHIALRGNYSYPTITSCLTLYGHFFSL